MSISRFDKVVRVKFNRDEMTDNKWMVEDDMGIVQARKRTKKEAVKKARKVAKETHSDKIWIGTKGGATDRVVEV